MLKNGWCRRPCGVRRRSAVSQLLGSRVRISLNAWMFFSCVCCVGMRRADHSSKGVIVNVCVCVFVWVWYRELKNELGSCSPSPQKYKKIDNLDSNVIQKIVFFQEFRSLGKSIIKFRSWTNNIPQITGSFKIDWIEPRIYKGRPKPKILISVRP